MSSYSSPLPAYVTPGWNDPPSNLNAERKANGGRLMTHKFRRPVDPSIQGTGFATAPPQNQTAQFQPQNGYVQYGNSAQVTGNIPPSNVPSEFAANATNERYPPAVYQQHNPHHRAIFDAFTIPSASSQQPYDFAQIRNASYGTDASAIQGSTPPLHQNFACDENSAPGQFPKCPVQANFVPPAPGPPIESNPSALIYTPPNVIGENQHRPATSPDPANYVPPMKAAGDVSLSGAQLVQFLTKATLRISPGVTRDGIQLRIGQLYDLVCSNAVSEGCIKKLNFVVDAMDRGVYDESLQFFEQLQSLFPDETKTSWAQGVRLLLQELKRPTRAGSAGPMGHH